MRKVAYVLAAATAIGLIAATPAKADFWFGAPGFGVGVSTGGPYYAGYYGAPYRWGGGPYYGWNGYYGANYDYEPSYAYEPYRGYDTYETPVTYTYERPAYRSYAYAPGYRCRTIIVQRPNGLERRVRRCY